MALEHIRDILPLLPAIARAYESPAEESLGERLRRAMLLDAVFQTQVPVETIAGRFRLDFVLTCSRGRRIAIEVDGRDFHDPERDRWRTALVLGANEVDAIYRVPATSIRHDLAAVIAELAARERAIFRPDCLAHLVEAPDSAPIDDGGSDWSCRENCEFEDNEREQHGDRMASRTSMLALQCTEHASVDWKKLFLFATGTGFSDIDAIVLAWRGREAPFEPTQAASL